MQQQITTTLEIRDSVISGFSKPSDHVEAANYIEKIFATIGEDVKVTPLVKELSITYATYKRAFYESKTKDDIFFKKYIEYEGELKRLTGELIRSYL